VDSFAGICSNYAVTFKDTFYEELSVVDIDSIDQFFQIQKFSECSFLYNLIDLAQIGHGSSVWHLDFNKDNLFKEKPTLIFGNKDDIRSMVYFWNIRATYPFNRTIWFPIELIDGHEESLREFEYCCNFSKEETVKNLITDIGINEIDCSQYYFGGYIVEWDVYENVQNVSIVDDKVRIQHPFDKQFSRHGLNVNFALEISGLTELHLPKSIELAKLFVSIPDDSVFQHYFARSHKLGLSFYCDHFEPLRRIPIVKELNLPNNESIFFTLFNEYNLNLIEKPSSSITNETIEMLGGYDGLEVITNQDIFDLIVKLAPMRSDRIVEKLRQTIELNDQEIESLKDLITENPTFYTSINPETPTSIETMGSMLPIPREKRNTLYPLIQTLYEKRILLRGKYFSCPYCKSKLWYPLESIQEENKCYGCNNQVQIPIFIDTKVLSDHFKLNELISIAVDQGLLPLMLTAYFLFKQPYYAKRFLFDYEIYSSDKAELLAEIDIVFTVGGKLGLAEVKANRGFQNNQTDRLLDIADKVNSGLVIFSTLKDQDTIEVRSLVQYLETKDLQIPAFIVTKKTLFSKDVVSIDKYFEVLRGKEEYLTGPIILQEKNLNEKPAA
jgi:hypothetical protein